MPILRFMIVGCGGYAGYHARRLGENPETQLVACVDISPAIVEAFIHQHVPALSPKPTVETDLATALLKHRVDAVVVATPHKFHAEHAAVALSAGCHVFIEKPMTISLAEARQLAARAGQMGRVVTVGYNPVCTPEFAYLRQVIRNPHSPVGLGKLEVVAGHLSQNWLHWTTGQWRQDPSISGGGVMVDTGAHLLAGLCWAVEAPVVEVFAAVDRLGSRVDINSALLLRFENGVVATIVIAGNCPSESSRLSFFFAGGRIEIDGWYGNWIEINNAYGRVKYPKIDTDQRGHTPLEHFIEAIQGRQLPRVTVDDGVAQAELLELIRESVSTGQPARRGQA